MPLSWPSYSDDTGIGTDGTALDKALLDEIRDDIEDAVFSVTNPTLSPADIADEVVDARGTFATLEDRIDDLQGVTSAASTGDTLAASDNVVKNPDLAGWKNGSAAAPDNFALSGAGAAAARVTGLGAGPHAVRITYGAAAALLTQDLIPTADMSAQASLGTEGRKVSVTVRVQTSTASQARIVVSDGVTSTESDYHTGGGTPENLTVTHTISGSATKLSFYCEVAVAGAADFCGFVASYTDSPSPGWQPPPRSGHRVLDINIIPAGNVGAASTDLMIYRLSPNILRANGVTIHVVAMGYISNTAGSKKLDFLFGSTSLAVLNGTNTTGAVFYWMVEAYIARVASGSQAVFTRNNWYSLTTALGSITAAETDTAEIIMKFTGDAAAVNNEIVQSYMLVEVLEPSAGI